jgi:hypothetical protein
MVEGRREEELREEKAERLFSSETGSKLADLMQGELGMSAESAERIIAQMEKDFADFRADGATRENAATAAVVLSDLRHSRSVSG